MKKNSEQIVSVMNVNISSSSYGYLQRLWELGAIEGIPGSTRIVEDLLPVVDALHQVLAGGKVRVTIEQTGTADVLDDLKQRLAMSIKETNIINEKAGYAAIIRG
jgi:hypothetical protein